MVVVAALVLVPADGLLAQEDGMKVGAREILTRGDLTGTLVWTGEFSAEAGIEDRGLYVKSPAGHRAQISARFDYLDDRFRYAMRFEESGWRAEFWYETSLEYENSSDMFNVGRKMKEQLEAGQYSLAVKFDLGPSVFAKTEGPFVSLRDASRELGPDLSATAKLSEFPLEVCEVLAFVRHSGVQLEHDQLDFAVGLAAFAALESEGAEESGCAAVFSEYEGDGSDWDLQRETLRPLSPGSQQRVPRAWREFISEFSKTKPKLRMTSVS